MIVFSVVLYWIVGFGVASLFSRKRVRGYRYSPPSFGEFLAMMLLWPCILFVEALHATVEKGNTLLRRYLCWLDRND